MIDHVGLNVRSIAVAKRFYQAVLAPLGYGLVEETTGAVAFGPEGKPLFWLYPVEGEVTPVHLAFVATTHATVEAFYAAAIASGAAGNGAPGLRPHYHAHYFGAFVLDPDGNNIEAVCHAPE